MAANKSQSFGNTCYLEIPDLGGYSTNFPAVFLQATVSGPARPGLPVGLQVIPVGEDPDISLHRYQLALETHGSRVHLIRSDIITCTRSTEADVI
jgi:hypothetical protein